MPWDQRKIVKVFSAINVACLDLAGKAFGVPAATLLGGIVRERVPYSAYLFYKVEGAGGDLAFETDPAATGWAVARQRAAFGPDVPLRYDPNALWPVDTSIRWGKELGGVLEYFEDPARCRENMAAVRRAVNLPMATNMCTTSFADLPGSAQHGSEAIILTDQHYWGGLRATIEREAHCRTFGPGVSMHSNNHAGISMAAMTHPGPERT